jgi:hypothetical protein
LRQGTTSKPALSVVDLKIVQARPLPSRAAGFFVDAGSREGDNEEPGMQDGDTEDNQKSTFKEN